MIASGMSSSTRLRMVRLRLRRFSASCIAARRTLLVLALTFAFGGLGHGGAVYRRQIADRGSEGRASVPWRCRGPARPEVRRHLRRRPRPHPRRRRAHRAHPARRQRRRGRGLGDGQDHRRPRCASPTRSSSDPAGREMDMLLTAGERISMALLCMALDRPRRRRRCRSPGRQAGIVTDTAHGKAKILEVKGDRIREALAAGKVARRRRLPGRVAPSSDDHHARPRRLRHHRGRARRRARRRRLRDLHRRRRRVHRRPAHRARGPQARARLASTRCSRWRPPAGACSRCARSSSPATTACRSTCARASPGSRAPGSPTRSTSMEAADHLGRHPRHLGGEGHDRPGARPARASRPRLFRALADDERQRRHDRAERVDRRPHRHLVHRAARRAHAARWRSSTRSSSRSTPAAPASTTPSAGCRSSARA